MQLSKNAEAVYKRLYLSTKLGETCPSDVHRRIAAFGADCEIPGPFRDQLFNDIFQMLENNEFRPNTPTMMNVGVMQKPQTSACFVGDLNDSLESIFNFDREAGFIYAQGSGLGGNYGMLRETNAALSTGGRSSGPFAFMGKLSATAVAVRSGGRTRRAAHMAMMFDHHPDIEQFITLKDGKDQTFSSMNLSVAVSDAFMQAVKEDREWNLIGVVDGKVKKTMPARELYQKIVQNAHKCGDPGIWFTDRANRDNTLKKAGRIVTTNPCGEQALLPHQACALGAINVAKCVSVNASEHGNLVLFDWRKLQKLVNTAVRFMDNCIDISGYPTPEYEKMAKRSRPIGLGIMGFADALLLMGFPYDSDEAIEFARNLGLRLTRFAIVASANLAKELGAFELYSENQVSVKEVVHRYFDMSFADDNLFIEQVEKYGLRNSHWTTIAPTGSTSISCDCSQGMEPLFAICYDKHLSDTNETWTFANPLFEQLYHQEPWYPEAIKKIAENHGSCKGIDLVPAKIQKLWVCAHDIHWRRRIEMQAALQEGISNSISSTINLPHDTDANTIGEIYMTAWEKGLKGLTIYRDRSLDAQPVTFGTSKEEVPPAIEVQEISRRPAKIRVGMTHEIMTGHGKVYFTVNLDKAGRPCEVFTNGAKNGSVNAANLEAMGRLISIALQEGTPIEKLAKTIENINDGTCVWDRLDEGDDKPACITSIPDAMGKVLRRFYCGLKEIPAVAESKPAAAAPQGSVKRCSKCNSVMYFVEGCEFCPQCGSKCG